jgi:iron complex transport system substrate-binding protein
MPEEGPTMPASQRTSTRLLQAGTAALAALALAACGTTEAPSGPDASAPAGEAVTVTDARGEAVEIPAGVEDVVALEWVVVEHLQTVGIVPVGVADVEGYQSWSGTGAPLEGEPTDLGTRQEPSIDAIAGLAPDLIVTALGNTPETIADLEAIAPVVVLQAADASKGLDIVRDDLRLVGEATGRSEDAEAAIEEFDARLEEIATQVEDEGLAGTPIAHLDGYENAGQIEIRTYADGALLAAAFQEVGFENAWTGEGDEQYGLGITDVEGLTALPEDAHIVYLSVGDDDVFANELSSNAVFQGLPAVQNGNVHRLPDGIWLFGGVDSVTAYLDALVEAITTTP